jgi:hypothetical protein
MSVGTLPGTGKNAHESPHVKTAGPTTMMSVETSLATVKNVHAALRALSVSRFQPEKFVLKDQHVRNVQPVLLVRFVQIVLHVRNVLQDLHAKFVQIIQAAKSVPMFRGEKSV